MLHSIKPSDHGPHGEAMARAVQTCVHCGFCLPACPTYSELGQEMDTPRGRIVLMKQVLEGALPPADAQIHIDRCLGCLACEPACPSGVPYRDLISPFRAKMEREGKFTRSPVQRLSRWMAGVLLPFPKRLRTALVAASVARWFRPILPRATRAMLDLAPAKLPSKLKLPHVTPASGERRGRVALVIGCAQQVIDPDINAATVDVLTRNGIEVVIPPAQGCCGGLAWHTGDLERAQRFARQNLGAFPGDVDAVLTNAAGCGSTMHEYGLILRGTPDEAAADALSRRVADVSAYLTRIGLREAPRGWATARIVAYQDACHLAHAQQVRTEPRQLLGAIPGVELRELPDAHLCCGSAGTYNIDQPELAASLGRKKAEAIVQSGASVVASGNIGCVTQLRAHLAAIGSAIEVRHTMQILRDAYRS